MFKLFLLEKKLNQAQEILDSGIDVNAKVNLHNISTLVEFAYSISDTEIANESLNQFLNGNSLGDYVYSSDLYDKTLLELALLTKSYDIARRLLEKGLKINMSICNYIDDPEAVKLLIEFGVDVEPLRALNMKISHILSLEKE